MLSREESLVPWSDGMPKPFQSLSKLAAVYGDLGVGDRILLRGASVCHCPVSCDNLIGRHRRLTDELVLVTSQNVVDFCFVLRALVCFHLLANVVVVG